MKEKLQEALRRLREAAAVECPTCRTPIPFAEPKCPTCGSPPTLRSAFRATFGSLKKNLEARAQTASVQTKRRIQWWYLWVSVLIVLILLPIVQGHYAAQAVSVVYVTALSAYVVWLAPVRWRRAYFFRASRIVKIATTLNFLSLIMLIQLAVEVWWGSALHFALLFLVTFAAGFLLHAFVIPLMYHMYLLLLAPTQSTRDPREQGRTVESDRQ
jgi:hypothetical protein